MAFYDGLSAAVQLGGDLQEHDCGDLVKSEGACITGKWYIAANWDTTDATQFGGVCAEPDWFRFPQGTVDMCVHQGELYVIWVELEDDGAGDHFVMGPYVKKWDGATWVAVGNAPVDTDPNLNQALFYYDKFTNSDPPAWLAPGHRTYPGMPKIASDGTTLYIAYTCRVNAAADVPPDPGNYWACGDPYGVVVPNAGPHDRWWPRAVVVRQLNGSNWDLIEVIPATTNNSLYDSFGTQVGGIGEIALCASPAEPGVCYVSFAEWGIRGTCRYYVLNPVFFVGFVFGHQSYLGWNARLVVVRFQSAVGVGQTLSSVFNADGFNAIDETAHPEILDIGSPVYIDNQTGTCYIWWGLGQRYMTRWDDLANVATLMGSGSANTSPTLSLDNDAYDMEISTSIPTREWEVQKDGLSLFTGLDGEPVAELGPPGTSLKVMIAEDPENIWAIAPFGNGDDPPNAPYVWLYHRPCRAWSRLVLALPPTAPNAPFGPAPMVQLGESLFVANYYFNPYLPYPANPRKANDFRVRVLEIPIVRDAFSCGVVEGVHLETESDTMPYISGLHNTSS